MYDSYSGESNQVGTPQFAFKVSFQFRFFELWHQMKFIVFIHQNPNRTGQITTCKRPSNIPNKANHYVIVRPGYAPSSSDEDDEEEDEFVQEQREPVDILMDRRLKEVRKHETSVTRMHMHSLQTGSQAELRACIDD